MNTSEFIKKQNTVGDIIANAVDKLETVGYHVIVQELIFDAENGSAKIKLDIS